jgi:hypothetical protein
MSQYELSASKPVWQSRTVWFNVIVGVLEWLAMHAEAGTLPAALAPYGIWILLFGNVLLRLITNGPVTLTKSSSRIGPAMIGAMVVGVAMTAEAAPPKAVVTGPATAQAGEFLTLSAADSTATHFRWRVQPEMSGRKTHEISADGKTLHLATIPGTRWRVVLLVSNEDGPDMAEHHVSITDCPQPIPTPPQPPGPTPHPPNPPAPNPQPVPPQPTPPVPPPSRFGLTAQVAEWTRAVPAENRATTATALANACESTAAAIAAGTLTGPRAILDAARAAITVALGDNASAWRSFSQNYALVLGSLVTSGRVISNSDWAEVLRETAAGLRQGASQ